MKFTDKIAALVDKVPYFRDHPKQALWIVGGVLAALIIAIVVLSVCIGVRSAQPEETVPTTVPTTEAPTTIPTTEAPTTIPTTEAPTTVPTTVPPETDPPVVYTNPLTGEVIEEVNENRPFAIIFNNIKAAMPQHGISAADVLCEALVEGTTRCLGICSDITDVETFGSIRSARPYFISLAQSFDAIFVHAGGSTEAYSILASNGWDHIDGVKGSGASKYYYRDQDRRAQGYSLEHTMFIRAESVIEYAEKMGCTMTREGGQDYGWTFSEEPSITGETATSIKAWFTTSGSVSSYIKSTTMDYNAEDGLYYASQYGTAWMDAGVDEQLSFRNVLILKAATVNQGDKSGHWTITLTGSGTGYYACGGQIVEINWSRESTSDPFSFTLADGTPLTLGVGKTYMGIIPGKGVVQYE